VPSKSDGICGNDRRIERLLDLGFTELLPATSGAGAVLETIRGLPDYDDSILDEDRHAAGET